MNSEHKHEITGRAVVCSEEQRGRITECPIAKKRQEEIKEGK